MEVFGTGSAEKPLTLLTRIEMIMTMTMEHTTLVPTSHQELGFGISIPAAKHLQQVPWAAVFGLCHAIKHNENFRNHFRTRL
jgi:hypothetical protein